MAEIPARRLGTGLPPQARAGLDQHAIAEQLAQRRSRRPASPNSTLPAPNPPATSPWPPTSGWTITRVNMAHYRTDHAGPAPMASPPPRRRLWRAATVAAKTNADHLPPPASGYSVTERSQHEQWCRRRPREYPPLSARRSGRGYLRPQSRIQGHSVACRLGPGPGPIGRGSGS